MKNNLKKEAILFVHLQNDYTGSTRALAEVIEGYRSNSTCSLLSSKGDGFLSNVADYYVYINFSFKKNRYWRILHLLFYQIIIFLKVWRRRKQISTVYVNTLLPFAAALAAKLARKKVIFHIHETAIRPKLLQRLICRVVSYTADEIIYVSHYCASAFNLKSPICKIRYNKLSSSFVTKTSEHPRFKHQGKILMLASLNKHKGLSTFLELAKKCPNYPFLLIISAAQKSIDAYFKTIELPKNLEIFPSQKNVHPFYHQAALVLNLSNPDYWIESFGMTILEAGFYARPCIAPAVGGPVELIEDKVSGFLIDPKELKTIKKIIDSLMDNETYYHSVAQKALDQAIKIQNKKFQKMEIV